MSGNIVPRSDGVGTLGRTGKFWDDIKTKKINGQTPAEFVSSNYTLPTASADTQGCIKVGDGLNVEDGVLSAPGALPVIVEGDAGKVVKVKADESGHEHGEIPAATTSAAGLMAASDKIKLDGVPVPATGDEGKTIKVNPSLAYELVASLGGLPAASSAETIAGIISDKAVTPFGLADGEFYRAGNIIGSVSVSGDVPTGAIIEQGNNANGYYIRFADGTQLCYAYKLISHSNYSHIWYFPASFASAGVKISLGVPNRQGGDARLRSSATGGYYYTAFSSAATFIVYDRDSTSYTYVTDDVDFGLFAIGRWY